MIRKTVAAAAVAASLIGGGAAGAALFAPNLAGAQTQDQQDQGQTQQAPQDMPDPKQHIRDTLQSLVDNGTITSEQADAVADTLAKAGPPAGGPHGGPGRGHHGPPLQAAAAAIGIDEDTLRTELQSGKTLAQVANDHGVSTETLVNALVADLEQHLADEVANGRITQEQADKMKSDAQTRITDMVNSQGPAQGDHGPGGPGGPPPGSDGDTGSSNGNQAPSNSAQSSMFRSARSA